jgi:hypothetical protein
MQCPQNGNVDEPGNQEANGATGCSVSITASTQPAAVDERDATTSPGYRKPFFLSPTPV